MTGKLSVRVVWGTLTIVVLSVLDLAFTLMHIDLANGVEGNPVMAYFLNEHGVGTFVSIKMFLTGIGVVVLAHTYSRAQWIKWALWSILCAYVILTMYHLFCAINYWS